MPQPPYNYAQYMGQPPQFAPAPHVQLASSCYASPQSATPTAAGGHHASTSTAFEYNSSRIPGLGMSSNPTSPLPSLSYRSEHDPLQPQASYGGYPASTVTRRQGSALTGSEAVNHSNIPPIATRPVPVQPNDVSEDGELSEGEFEDLYDTKAVDNTPLDGAKVHSKTLALRENTGGSAGDADGSSIYDTGSTRGDVVIDSASASQPAADDDDDYEPGEYEPEYQPRDKTRSYSPCLSTQGPLEPHESQPSSAAKSTSSQIKDSVVLPQSMPSLPSHSNTLQKAANGAAVSNENKSSAGLVSIPADPQALTSPKFPYKSVSEAKKKAQEAILGLWPFKVRYQNYLDEGIDPSIVNSLFTELGLDSSVPKPITLSQTQPAVSIQVPPDGNLIAQSPPKPVSQTALDKTEAPKTAPLNQERGNSKMESKKSAQEERKDKIARMLAEKSKRNAAQPTPATTTNAAPVRPTNGAAASTPGPSDAAKVKLRAQNNQKILEKLAALKKQQGIKSASTEQSVPTTTSESTKTQDNTAQDLAPAPQQATRDSARDNDASSNQGGPFGLSVSSSPQPTPKIRNMKRPVASDFDAYPSNGNAMKRTRTQETLIIDVSDDEDVEMDLGSPTEPSSSMIPKDVLPLQNSLAAFPPLTNARNWRVPKSSSATPAIGTPSEHGQKLDLLTQQIQEARRKIAEAEAKNAAIRMSNGASFSAAPSPVHTPGPESSRLPKSSEASRAPNSGRRERLASFHIPTLDAALEEKKNKLQRLKVEAAQLELEVQATLEERQKLTLELEGLEATHIGGSPQVELQETPPYRALIPDPSERASISDGAAFARRAESEQSVAESILAQPTLFANAIEAAATIPEQVMSAIVPTGSSASNLELDSSTPSHAESSNETQIVANGTAAQVDLGNAAITQSEESQSQTPNHRQTASSQSLESMSVESGSEAIVQSTDNSGGDGDSSDEQPLVDADVPMQISDAEDDDSYEPIHPQISNVDQALVAPEEDAQIPDKEPYEPSLTQVTGPATRTELDAPTGEVEPFEAVSVKDLLSYQSPLRYFQAYKFHPQFKDTVPGGLRSMTYSSKIDVSRPICPSLIDGGQCLDGPECKFQHFDDIKLSESAIIAELGSTDMYKGEQKDRFIDGLKRVLSNLKAKKIKDFDSITKALIHYRSEFLGDKSKVLPLNDTVI